MLLHSNYTKRVTLSSANIDIHNSIKEESLGSAGAGGDTPELYEKAQADVAKGLLRHPITTARGAPSSP